MSIDKNDNCINVYTHPNISQKILQEFIEKNILRFHKFIQSKKSNFELNSKASYIYLLNEKYQVQVIQAKSHRKYEIYNKNIYLQCHKPSDKLFLIKKILSDYCNKFVVPLFNQLAKKMQIKNVKLAFR
jgi:hypothetical protein